jgi:hypothetical protein
MRFYDRPTQADSRGRNDVPSPAGAVGAPGPCKGIDGFAPDAREAMRAFGSNGFRGGQTLAVGNSRRFPLCSGDKLATP